MHKHGPRTNRCTGSQQPQLVPSVQVSSQASNSQSASTRATSTVSSQPHPVDGASGAVSFSSVDCAIVKRFPTSARTTSASHLCRLLNSIFRDPENPAHWHAVLQCGQGVLVAQKRGGRKYDIAASIVATRTLYAALEFAGIARVRSISGWAARWERTHSSTSIMGSLNGDTSFTLH